MQPRPNLSLSTLLVVISVLAVAGGLATVYFTSPQSFDLGRLTLLQAIIAPESSPSPSATPSLTPVPPSPTLAPTVTASRQAITYLPTDTDTPAGQPSTVPLASVTSTATGVLLPFDVRALAVVSDRVGSQLVRVHTAPNGAVMIAAIPAGTVVQVLFGSAVVDGVEWLPVRLSPGRAGWVAGYLLTITVQRPGDSGTAEVTDIPTATATPTPPGPTSHAPPKTAAPAATHTSAAATPTSSIATVNPGQTLPPINPPTPTWTPIPVANTNTPTQAPSNTPVTPSATTPPQDTATFTPIPADTNTPIPSETSAPADTPTDIPTAENTPG